MADKKIPDPAPARTRDPDLHVEKALLGEQPAGASLLAGAEPRLEALRTDNAAVLDRYPARRVAAEIDRRLREERQPRRMWQLAWAPAALALVLVVVWGLRPHAPIGGSSGGDPIGAGPDEITLKGGVQPELRIYLKHGARPERLRDGSAVRGGDVVQLTYLAAGRRAGVIVSIDGRGSATLHHPPPGAAGATGGDASALQSTGAEVPLPRAYQLDDAPRFERFFFVTAADPAKLDVQAIVGAARTLAQGPAAERDPLPLSPSLQQSSVRLRKVTQ
jgi:hypothetical protein